MKRLVLFPLFALVLLIVLAYAVVQAVLWTNWPRDLVQSALRDATGLHITIDELETGWGGHTEIGGLTATLPLEDQPFVRAPSVSVTHAGLIKLLLLRSLDLDEVTADNPVFKFNEGHDGVWTPARIVRLVQNANGDDSVKADGWPDLPSVVITNATVEILHGEDPATTFELVDFNGKPGDRWVWSFNLQHEGGQLIEGQIAVKPPMTHTVRFDLDALDRYLDWSPTFPEPLPSIRAAGLWTGQVDEESLSGMVRLDALEVGEHKTDGAARVHLDDDGIRLSILPAGFNVTAFGQPPIRIESGTCRVDSERVSCEQVVTSGFGARGQFDGSWSMDQRRGNMTAALSGSSEKAVPNLSFAYDGKWNLSLETPRVGPIRIESNLSMDAESSSGDVRAELQAVARGSRWSQLEAIVRAPSLEWTDRRGSIVGDGLIVGTEINWPHIHLVQLELPGTSDSLANGTLDLNTNEWSLSFDARDWIVPRTISAPVKVSFDAEGDLTRLDFSRLQIDNERFEFLASGRYLPSAEEPLQARAQIALSKPLDYFGQPFAINEPGKAGMLESSITITGDTTPLDLAYQGQLTLRDVTVGEKPIGELSLPWTGHIDEARTTFQSDAFAMFDGRWELVGAFDHETESLDVELHGRETPLNELVTLIDLPVEVGGRLDATVRMRLPGLNPEQLSVEGDWGVAQLRTRQIQAERGRGRFRFRNHKLELHDFELAQRDGRIRGSAAIDLNRRNELEVDLRAENWPMAVENTKLSMLVGAVGQLTVDLPENRAVGALVLASDVLLDGEHLGNFSATASVDQRTIHVERLHGDLMGGEIDGSGTVPFGDWLSSGFEAEWRDIDLSKLSAYTPTLEGLVGTSNGRMSISESNAPRTIGPLRIDVDATVTDGAYQEHLEIGDFQLVAFANKNGVTLESGTVDAMDGQASLWGRTSIHNGELYLYTQVDLKNIELAQILQAVDPTGETTPGRIDGSVTIGTYAGQLDRTFGTGRINLRNTDLGRLPAFDLLYGLLQFDFGRGGPTGTGFAQLRFEGRTVEVSKLEYFNRGTDVAGTLTIMDVTKGGHSPIRGVFVGAVRPFRDLDLPLVGDLDRLVAALQADAVAVQIDGTLAERQVRSVDLAEVGSTIRRILTAGVSGD